VETAEDVVVVADPDADVVRLTVLQPTVRPRPNIAGKFATLGCSLGKTIEISVELGEAVGDRAVVGRFDGN
jgi:hypothetical protein